MSHRTRSTGRPAVRITRENYRPLRDSFTPAERARYRELMGQHTPAVCGMCARGRVSDCEWSLQSVESVVLDRGRAEADESWRLHAVDYKKQGMY